MSNFIGSDSISDFIIGAANNPNAIVAGEVYPLCHFPGSDEIRRLTFSLPVDFIQSQQNQIDLINEDGEVVFSFDTGNIPRGGNTISKDISVNISATSKAIQTIGVRWSRGGAVELRFNGQIFVFNKSEMVEFG